MGARKLYDNTGARTLRGPKTTLPGVRERDRERALNLLRQAGNLPFRHTRVRRG